MNIKYIILIWLFGFSALRAQTPVSLDEALDIAYRNNASIQAASFYIQEAKSFSRSAFTPGKTLLYYQNEERNQELQGIESIGISQNIAFPGQYIYKKSLLELNLNISEAQLVIQKRNVARQTASSYYQLLFLHAQIKKVRFIDSLLINMLETSSERYKHGETGKLELVNARALSVEFKARLQKLLKDLRIEEKSFNSLLQAKDTFSVDQSEFKRLTVAYDELSNWKTEHPESHILSYKKKSASENVKYKRSFLFPDLNLQYYRQKVEGQSGYYGFNIGIYIPIWFKPQTSQLQAARNYESAIIKETENSTLLIQNQLEALQSALVKNEKILQYYEEEGRPLSQELTDVVQLEYQSGNIGYLEYLQSIRQAYEIELNYLAALNNYNQTVIQLNYWTYEIFNQ